MKSGQSMRLIRACGVGLLLLPFAAPAQAPAPASAPTVLARGVEYRHLQPRSPAGEPWSIHVLEVSRTENSVELRALPGHGEDGSMQRERPTSMAGRLAASGEDVLAVVNGDFDLPAPYLGVPDGLSVASGRLWTTGQRERPTMALLRSGEPVIAVARLTMEMTAGKRRWDISALNKPFGAAWGTGPRLYTREFRPAVKSDAPFAAIVIGGLSRALPLGVDVRLHGVVREQFASTTQVAIPPDGFVLAQRLATAGGPAAANPFAGIQRGDEVRVRTRITMAGKKNIREAIGGFPILVQEGRRHVAGNPGANLRLRHPRTALCTNERRIIFVVVDGRQPQLSVGMTLEELADVMVSLGCTTAMNTDGGGSSVMAIASSTSTTEQAQHPSTALRTGAVPLRIVNSPSDGQERGRGNAWVIIRRR